MCPHHSNVNIQERMGSDSGGKHTLLPCMYSKILG